MYPENLNVSQPRFSSLLSVLILALLVTSGMAAYLAISPAAASGAPPPVASPGAGLAVHPAATNSNIVVNAGVRYLNGTGGSLSIGGNVTVENGGHLYLNNITLSFASFTVNSTNGPSALLHRFHVLVESGGALTLWNSKITTNSTILRTYPKLNLTVEGASTLALHDGSAIETAGWVYVTGNSQFLLYNSAVEGNPVTYPGAPGNFTGDNSFAPFVTITGGSSAVSVGSYFNSTYADSSATQSPSQSVLSENFAMPISPQLNISGGSGNLRAPLTPSTPLVLDTYPTFSSASILISYNNSGRAAQTVTGNLTVMGASSAPESVVITPGLGTTFVPLPASYVASSVSLWNLSALLSAFQSNQVNFTLSAPSGAPVSITQVGLSLIPSFNYNITVEDSSSFYAVDSSFSLTWTPTPGPGSGVQPSSSNKLLLTGGSTGYLVNSSAFLPYNNVVTDVSAFVPDSTSTLYAFQWLSVPVHNSVGLPVPGVGIRAFSTLPSSNPNNVTANDYSSASWLKTNLPLLYGALVASSTHAYGVSGKDGQATLSVLSNVVSGSDLPGGTSMGSYNLTLSQSAETRTGGTTNISVSGGTGTGCAWPMGPTCARPLVLQNVSIPVLAADLRLSAGFLSPATATAPSTYYEGRWVHLVLNVSDMSNLAIPTPPGQVPITISDSFSGGTGLLPANDSFTTYVTNANITTGNVTLNIGWMVPYLTAGTHTVWVQLDPNGTVATPNDLNKTLVLVYRALGVPFEPTPVVDPGMLDGCTGGIITPSSPNSCNSVVLTANVYNYGDAPASGAIVSFQLNGASVGSPVTLPSIGALGGSGTARLATNVTCTCNTVVNAEVQWTYPIPVSNPPNPILFSASSLPLPTVDYTSVTVTNVTQLTLASTGKLEPALSNSPVPIGGLLAFNVTLTNSGGPGSQANLSLELDNGSGAPVHLVTEVVGTGGVFPGHTTLVQAISWHVPESIIGSHTGPRRFYLVAGWTNGGTVSSVTALANVTIEPSLISFTGMAFSSLSTQSGGSAVYTLSGGTIHFNGTGSADLTVYLSDPLNPADNYSVGTGVALNATSLVGEVHFSLSSNGAAVPPGQYSLVIRAYYNGGQKFYNFPAGTVTLTSPPTTAKPFYETPLGWIIIAVVAAAIVAGVLIYMRRSGQGQLVECGECGELIPATATVCPKCGAEFEPEVVRCSRCASTIPAQSTVCPECAALLLGTEGTTTSEDDQRKAYGEFVERFRAEGRKELGENYNEGSFWDWWKRQGSYQSYSAWKLQQAQGTRTGMAAPSAEKTSEEQAAGGSRPPGGGSAAGAPAPTPSAPPTPPSAGPAGPGGAQGAAAASTTVPPSPTTRACPSCGREINSDFLVCPFCGAVTR